MAYKNHMGLRFFRVFLTHRLEEITIYYKKYTVQRGKLSEMYIAQKNFRWNALTFHSESKRRKNNTFNNASEEKCWQEQNVWKLKFNFIILAAYFLLFSGKMLESPNYLGKRRQKSLLRSLQVKAMTSWDWRRQFKL